MMAKYRPTSGSEAESFQHAFCDKCIHDRSFRTGNSDKGCSILLHAWIYTVEDKGYPNEWIYDENGRPTCTSFENTRRIKTKTETKNKNQISLFEETKKN